MRKFFLVASTGLAALTLLAAAPAAQADPSEQNHGQCVSSSPKPDGRGGRSGVARDKESCPAPHPAPLTCSENGDVNKDAEHDTVTVTGTGAGTPGSSLECATDIAVTAGQTVSFVYALTGDPCGGGVPRVFVLIDGTYYNTFDGDPDCSEADGTTITYTIPVTGTVTQVGLVYDRGDTESVTYSGVTVGGAALDF